MKTIKEMKDLVDKKVAKVLTIGEALKMRGKKIQTIYFGYAGQDDTDEFVVGDVISEFDYYKNLKEDCFPDENGNKNRAEYWESYMTKEQLQQKKDKHFLIRDNGSNTYIYTYIDDQVFVCSDDDRWVYYIEA